MKTPTDQNQVNGASTLAAPVDRMSANTAGADLEDVFKLDEESEASPERKRRLWPWVLLLLLVIGLGSYYYWNKSKARAAIPTYKTAKVTRGDIVQSVTANGQIAPIKTVTVGSQVSGIITEIKVDFNSQVTNGQVLAQIDPSTYQQSLIQAQADVANAKAALSLAQMNFNRNKELLAGNALPKADYESSQAALEQAQATVKSKDAALHKAQVDLERTTIYSPIDGTVISRAVDVGQTVAATLNAPVLFTVAQDLRQMHIEASVSEADIGGVKNDQEVQFTVDAFPNNIFRGKVTQVRYQPSTNQNVVNYTTIVEVNNDDLQLRPGMTANATIVTASRKNVLRVQNSALRFTPSSHATKDEENAPKSKPGTKTVYVLDTSESSAPRLKPVFVKTGANDNFSTEIVEGLNESDVVVTGSAQAAVTAGPKPGGSSNPFSGGGMRPR